MEMSWSRWFRCESSFELLLVPKQPGVFAIAEEVVEPSSPVRDACWPCLPWTKRKILRVI